MKRYVIVFMLLCAIFSVILFAAELHAQFPQSRFGVVVENTQKLLGDDCTDIVGRSLSRTERKQGSQTFDEYRFSWGSILTPLESTTMFGIEQQNNDIDNLFAVRIGDTKATVVERLGKPFAEHDGIWYYYNNEFDVLELQIVFAAWDSVRQVNLYLGT